MQTSQNRRTFSLIGPLVFCLALLVAGFSVAIPTITTFLMSLQNFNVARGIFGSPFNGANNYLFLFHTPVFAASIAHSAQFALASAATLFVSGALVGYGLRALSPVRWAQHALCTLLLVPLLVPGEVWAQAFFAVFSPMAVQSLPLLSLWCGLKYIGLAALLTTAALGHSNRSGTLPLLTSGVTSLGLFALLGLWDFAFLKQLPSLSVMRDSLDLLVYRFGVEQIVFDISSAATVITLILRAVLLAAVAFPIAALLKQVFPQNITAMETTTKDRLRSLLACAAVMLVVAIMLVVAALGTPIGAMTRNLTVYPVYVILAFIGAAISTALCWCLAWPVVTAKPAGRIAAAAALLLLTALGAIPMSMGGYVQFRFFTMENTFFPVLLSGIGSAMGVWPLVFAAKGLGVRTNEDWLKHMWRPALALMAVNAALRMNDTVQPTLFIVHRDMQHPLQALNSILAGYSTLSGGTMALAAASALMALVTMAVPVILLLLVRTVFTEQETVGLGVPGK